MESIAFMSFIRASVIWKKVGIEVSMSYSVWTLMPPLPWFFLYNAHLNVSRQSSMVVESKAYTLPPSLKMSSALQALASSTTL